MNEPPKRGHSAWGSLVGAVTIAVALILLGRFAPSSLRTLPRAGQEEAAPVAARTSASPKRSAEPRTVGATSTHAPDDFDRSALDRLAATLGAPAAGVDAAAIAREAIAGAERGDATARAALGILYAEARGVPRDTIAAERLWLAAAEQGDAGAAHNLGVLYGRGVLGAPDPDRAREWLARAAQRP